MVQAGQIMTADTINESYPWIMVKHTDQQVVSSSTPQNDVDLWAPLESFSTYEVEMYVSIDSSVDAATSNDASFSWAIPSGSIYTARQGQGPSSGMTSVASTTMTSPRSYWTNTIIYGTDDLPSAVSERGVVRTGANPGILQLRWAQLLSNANPLTLRAGSVLIVRRVE